MNNIIRSEARRIPLKGDELCFECNDFAVCYHHVVPFVHGGRVGVPLCSTCHAKAHNIANGSYGDLIKAGLKKTKEKGTRLGTPPKFSKEMKLAVIEDWFKTGDNYRTLAQRHNMSIHTVLRILKETK